MDIESRLRVGKLIRYLANSLLAISIIVFLMSMISEGLDTYSNQLLWTQMNSMWLVVIMLILVENFYLHPKEEVVSVKKKVEKVKKSE